MYDLYNHINNSCIEFIAVTEIGGEFANILFTGMFQGNGVVWDAEIRTTRGVQYIDVGVSTGQSRKIQIGLNIGRITEPDIFKVMMMIRQYRKLESGRHEFSGPAK